MDRGDRGLQLILADRPFRNGGIEQGRSLDDQRAVPKRPILFCERDQLTVFVGARIPAGVEHEHEREEADDLRIVRTQPMHDASEPDRFVRQLGAV